MVLSLSPGDTPIERGDHVMKHANMWRISDDFWDRWEPLHGLTIATTALSDGRVKCCAPAVPFLGDFMHHLQIRTAYVPEFTAALKAAGRGTFADVARTMSYVDTVNLAPWIRCPVLMGSGLFDDDCPPHINFAVYNHLGGPKEYRVYPSRPHNLHPEWEPDSRAWLRRQLGLP